MVISALVLLGLALLLAAASLALWWALGRELKVAQVTATEVADPAPTADRSRTG
jgi:hypothetical protein